MSFSEPTCYSRRCKHWIGLVKRPVGIEKDMIVTSDSFIAICRAFPDGIPDEIAFGPNPHSSGFNGDHGIQFERLPDGDTFPATYPED